MRSVTSNGPTQNVSSVRYLIHVMTLHADRFLRMERIHNGSKVIRKGRHVLQAITPHGVASRGRTSLCLELLC